MASNGLTDTNDMVRAMRLALQSKAAKPVAVTAREVSPAPLASAPTPRTIEIQPAPAVAIASPQSAVEPAVAKTAIAAKTVGSRRYALAFIAATLAGMASIWAANRTYAPEMYGLTGMVPAAAAHAKNLNYAVFDLNLNIRALRDEQLKRMTKTPDVVILGASHWQEAHKNLIKGEDAFNAHIHRDYWEDPLGMVELLVRHNRLPKKLIISLRDNQFTPVEARKDFLWEPGIPAYRAMAARLGLEAEPFYKTLPYDRGRALISLPMLFENVTRWYNATERPHASELKNFKTLDTLLPDGSIVWADKHMKLFTHERAEKEALAFAERNKNKPPLIDPKGVAAFEALLKFLKEKGVSVYLVNPPFNPIYYDHMQGTPYFEGLKKFEALVQRLARDHGLPVFGGFNPHTLGCTADQYIDAEHANEKCLQKVFDQYMAINALRGTK